MIKGNRIFIFLYSILGLFFLQQCANPVSPTGGAKDTSPPELVKAFPLQQSTNFNSAKIKLTFNEFVELKDLNKQLIVSPPMNENPDIRIKQKSIEIIFNEELLAKTTYNIFFGDAIVDITEGNPLSNFQYVFSTGNVLDSMTFKGSVVDAFNLDPIEGISVMLYINNNDTLPFDSLPYFVRPYFMSRTNEQGLFTFNNLPNKDFKIFALQDGNGNLMFDQKSERIAFSVEEVSPYYIPLPKPIDTTLISDSLAETTIVDSLFAEFIEPDPLSLFMFEEVDSVQRIIKGTLAQKNQLLFVFKRPVREPEFRILDVEVPLDWKIQEIFTNGDSIAWWLKSIPADSLEIEISDNQKILDTLKVPLVKFSRKKEKPDEEEKTETLNLILSKSIKFDEPLNISFKYPIGRFVPDSILLVEGEDSLSTFILFDDKEPRKARIEHPWLERTNYSIEIPDSVFTDILGRSNDTLRKSYTVPKKADFGNVLVHLNFRNPKNSYIFQLIKEDKIIKEYFITESKDIRLENVKPGEYQLKLIYDQNNNGKWDPGHYIKGFLPEQVILFPTKITVRANWDVEEEWNL